MFTVFYVKYLFKRFPLRYNLYVSWMWWNNYELWQRQIQTLVLSFYITIWNCVHKLEHFTINLAWTIIFFVSINKWFYFPSHKNFVNKGDLIKSLIDLFGVGERIKFLFFLLCSRPPKLQCKLLVLDVEATEYSIRFMRRP